MVILKNGNDPVMVSIHKMSDVDIKTNIPNIFIVTITHSRIQYIVTIYTYIVNMIKCFTLRHISRIYKHLINIQDTQYSFIIGYKKGDVNMIDIYYHDKLYEQYIHKLLEQGFTIHKYK